MYTTTGITFAYAPDAVSTRACNFPGAYESFNSTWTRMNYNDLYYPPSNQVLSSRYQQCYPGSSAVNPERLLKSNGFTFPVLSLHDDLKSLDPAWKGCTPVVGAFDPPRVLQSVTTLNDAHFTSTQIPKASPALKVTPLYASAPTAAFATDHTSSHALQQALPVLNNANPVASPMPKKASTVQEDRQESIQSQPTYDQPANAEHGTSNPSSDTPGSFDTPHLSIMTETARPSLGHSLKPFIVPTSVNTVTIPHNLLDGGSHTRENNLQISGTASQIGPQALTKFGPVISDGPQSALPPPIAGHEIHQAPSGGAVIGSITLRPEAQTTIKEKQLASISKSIVAVDTGPTTTISGTNTIAESSSAKSHTSTPEHTISVGFNSIILDGNTYTLPPLTSTISSQTSPRSLNAASHIALTPPTDSPTNNPNKPAALPAIKGVFAESPTTTLSLPSIFSVTAVYESATDNTAPSTQASSISLSGASAISTHTPKPLTSSRSAVPTSQKATTSRLFAPKTSAGAVGVGDRSWVICIAFALLSWGMYFGV